MSLRQEIDNAVETATRENPSPKGVRVSGPVDEGALASMLNALLTLVRNIPARVERKLTAKTVRSLHDKLGELKHTLGEINSAVREMSGKKRVGSRACVRRAFEISAGGAYAVELPRSWFERGRLDASKPLYIDVRQNE